MSETVETGINGFGRIGTLYARIAIDQYSDEISVAAINGRDATDIADRLAYDSTHGPFRDHEVRAKEGADRLHVDGRAIEVVLGREPEKIGWERIAPGLVVVEATGNFNTYEQAHRHIEGGAHQVIITAPAKDAETTTIVRGVNDTEQMIAASGEVVAVSSCSTNCIAPIIKVLSSKLDIRWAQADIIHAYTNSQRILDGSGSSSVSRRSFDNTIPASTGSSKEVRKLFPDIDFHSNSFRVPVADGSLAILRAEAKGRVNMDNVLDFLQQAAVSPEHAGIIELTEDPMTSGRVIGRSASAVIDKNHIIVREVNGHTIIELQAWFDNEWGYANRVAEVTKLIGQKSLLL